MTTVTVLIYLHLFSIFFFFHIGFILLISDSVPSNTRNFMVQRIWDECSKIPLIFKTHLPINIEYMIYYSKIKETTPYASSHTKCLKILGISIGYVKPKPKKGNFLAYNDWTSIK